MQSIGAFQAKTHFSAILDQVEKGEQIIITKHGRPVARIIPETAKDLESVQHTIERIKKFAQAHTLGGLNWKELRDDGRR